MAGRLVLVLGDQLDRGVIDLVNTRFADHPGSLANFDWPVTPADARAALDDFLAHRLANFGQYQDAIWTGEPWLFHARLSQAMNMKLLDPRDVVAGAERAWREGRVPLRSEEGHRPRRLPVHDALLGLSCAAREAARRQSADDDAAPESVAQGGCRRAGDPPPGGRSAGASVVECREARGRHCQWLKA